MGERFEKRLARDIMYHIDTKEATVKQYSYRSARIRHLLLQIERNDKLEKLLSNKANKQTDNHTLYEVTFADGSTFAIECSDSAMRIGVGVSVASW